MPLPHWVGSLVLILGLALAAGVVRAADELYVVRAVPVDATAASATEARDLAIAQGRAEAWSQLYRRLTPESEWGKIPALDDASIEALVQSFNVQNERRSSTRYLAEITYTFSPADVENVLAQSGASFSAAQAQPVVVIPVLDTGNGRVLWGTQNPWGEAFAAANLTGALVPILVPSGDVEDVATVTADGAMQADWVQLQPLVERYGAAQALVASAVLGPAGIEVITRLVGLEGAVSDRITLQSLPEEEEAALMARAVAAISTKLQEDWKGRTAASGGQTSQLTAVARFSTLSEWAAIRKALAGLPTIERLDIGAVTLDGATVALVYRGGPAQLGAALAANGLTLVDLGGSWEIAPARFQSGGQPPGQPGGATTY